MSRWVLHVDLDQFLAAVEVLRHPELSGKPLVVGGDGDPAKRGVVLPVDAPRYNAVSAVVMDTLRDSGSPVEVLGWDEAFVGADTDDPEAFARGLMADVKEATQLDCSVGIGENKLQAKIATGFGKPAGVFRITSATWFDVLGDRAPDAIWGIGPKTLRKLEALSITTVRQLAAADPDQLAAQFGPTTGPWLVILGRGRGDADVDPTPYVPRSQGREVTYQENISDWAQVRAEVTRLARLVSSEIPERPVNRLIVKIRYAPFITQTHGVSLHSKGRQARDAELGAEFEAAALAALAKFEPDRPVRLLGVRAEFSGG